MDQRAPGKFRFVIIVPMGDGPLKGGGYLTATLRAIVNGHKQSQINDLLPWNYAVKV